MMARIIFVVEFFLIVLIQCSTESEQHRSKRFLTFPRTSPTRYQLITGIGIPVDLEIESVTIGWVQKCEFFLPENATNFLSFLNDPYDLTTRPIYGWYDRRKRDESGDEPRPLLEEPKPTENPFKMEDTGFDSDANEKFEKHQVEVEIVDSGTDDGLNQGEVSEADYWNQEDRAPWLSKLRPNQPNNLDMARFGVYQSMAILAQTRGLDGRSCVLRAICESAHTSFDYSNGILGELMHIVMTPSLSKDEINSHEDNEYFHAEKLGSEGAPCERVFKECKTSILDQFSGIYTPMLDIIRNLSV